MQTKRKQTLLAGVGLLTALSLSMVGCTPSNFTPGSGVPTQSNPAQDNTSTAPSAQSVTTYSGTTELKGAPFTGDVKVFNAFTGALIAAGGANLKTDDKGNFSVDVAGLKADDVVRVEVSNGDQALSSIMTADGVSTVPSNTAGYAVAQAKTKFSLTINAATTFQSFAILPLLRLVAMNKRADQTNRPAFDATRTVKEFQTLYTDVDAQLRARPDQADYMAKVGKQNTDAYSRAATLSQFAKDAGIVDTLNNTLTTIAQQVARENAGGTLSINKNDFVGVTLDIEVTATSIKIGDTVINLDTGTVDVPKADPEAPVLTVEEQKTEAEENLGVWINSGNMNPTVTIGTNSVQVSQSSGQVQMTSLTLLLPKANLTNGSLAHLSGGGLTGSVSGSDRSGTARAGALTFTNTSIDTSLASGTVSMAGFGQIGTYTVKDLGGTWEIKMSYTFNELGVEFVGAHSTSVTSSAVTLTKNDGMSILIAGDGASSRVQF